MIIVGLYHISEKKIENFRSMFNGTSLSSRELLHLGPALYGGLWCYDGWHCINNVIEEMKNVGRDLLPSIMIAFPFVILCYSLLILSFFTLLTRENISVSSAVGIDYINLSLGKKTSYLMMILIAVSGCGTLNATLFANPRLTLAAAREGHMPKFLSLINERTKTPIPATIATSLIAMLILIPKRSDLSSLILLFSQAQWIMYGLSIFGVIILRVKKTHVARPFKVFIVIPIVMSFVVLALLITGFIESPFLSIALFGFILAGIPIYIIFVHYHDKLPIRFVSVISNISGWLQKHCGMVPCKINHYDYTNN